MGTKSNGQNKLLIAILFLILMLSYCAIPSKDTTHPPEADQKTEHAKEAAVHHEEPADDHAAKETVHEEAPAEHAAKEAVHEEASAEHAVKEAVKHEEKAVEPPKEAAEGHGEETAAAKPQASEAHGGAASNFPDVIPMNNPEYAKHTKGIVQFSHKKHVEAFKAGCGKCHHDDSGQPLTDLKIGDEVDGCIGCHSNPGKAPKSKDNPLTKEQELEYHAEAIHMNCIDCHKAHNEKNNTKAAPTACGKCHPKD